MSGPDAGTAGNQRPGTTHPRLARERALKVLFAADVRGVDPRRLLDEVETNEVDRELLDELEPDQEQVDDDEELQLELKRRERLPLDDYTRLLVDGVASRRPQIDDLLGEVADNWQVQRMPRVDRNLLRLGIYELAEQDTPPAVVIDEAVSLAVAFAGDKAQSFVNGVLEEVRKRIVAGEVDLTPPAPAPDAPTAVAEEGVEAGGVTEPEVTTDDLAEVDEAAQQAYDLTLDLLEAAGPAEPVEADDRADDADAADVADPAEDADAATAPDAAPVTGEEPETGATDETDVTDDLRDASDALW